MNAGAPEGNVYLAAVRQAEIFFLMLARLVMGVSPVMSTEPHPTWVTELFTAGTEFPDGTASNSDSDGHSCFSQPSLALSSIAHPSNIANTTHMPNQ